jgi:DNA-binding response OmpR family regulator
VDLEGDVICASASSWRRRRLSRILEGAGYRVRTCGSADELLDLAAQVSRRPDDDYGVLILDAELGNALAPSRIIAALRRSGTPLRTIVLAEPEHAGEVIECLREGADDFVHLPAEPAQIVEVVGRVSALPNLV